LKLKHPELDPSDKSAGHELVWSAYNICDGIVLVSWCLNYLYRMSFLHQLSRCLYYWLASQTHLLIAWMLLWTMLFLELINLINLESWKFEILQSKNFRIINSNCFFVVVSLFVPGFFKCGKRGWGRAFLPQHPSILSNFIILMWHVVFCIP